MAAAWAWAMAAAWMLARAVWRVPTPGWSGVYQYGIISTEDRRETDKKECDAGDEPSVALAKHRERDASAVEPTDWE